MTGRVGRAPTANPFASRFVRPGAVPFLFGEGRCVAELADRLGRQGGWGQVVGPHGSGKSTLLAALLPELRRRWRVAEATLHTDRRRLPGGVWSAGDGPPTMVVIDGFEQLTVWGRWRVRAFCRRLGHGLLVTAHRSVGLPDLYRTAVTPELAGRVIDRLLAGAGHGPAAGYDVAGRLAARGGNLRDVLFELYDVYEQSAGPR